MKNYNISVEEINKEIDTFTKTSMKRKEHAQFIALACMQQGKQHRNLTPLANFANTLSKNEANALRIWSERYSPARKRKDKDGKIVYKYMVTKGDEQEQEFDFKAMEGTNFLDIDIVTEELNRIFSLESFEKRILKLIKDADRALEGKTSIEEKDKEEIQILRDNLVRLSQGLAVDGEAEEPEDDIEPIEVNQAA